MMGWWADGGIDRGRDQQMMMGSVNRASVRHGSQIRCQHFPLIAWECREWNPSLRRGRKTRRAKGDSRGGRDSVHGPGEEDGICLWRKSRARPRETRRLFSCPVSPVRGRLGKAPSFFQPGGESSTSWSSGPPRCFSAPTAVPPFHLCPQVRAPLSDPHLNRNL